MLPLGFCLCSYCFLTDRVANFVELGHEETFASHKRSPLGQLSAFEIDFQKSYFPALIETQNLKQQNEDFVKLEQIKDGNASYFLAQFKTFAGCLQSCSCIVKLTLTIICETTCINCVARGELSFSGDSSRFEAKWCDSKCKNAKNATFSSATIQERQMQNMKVIRNHICVHSSYLCDF